MILDTSAIMAIVSGEEDALRLSQAILSAPSVRISAATHVELSVVGHGRDLLPEIDAYLAEAGVTLAPFDGEQASIARQARLRYGGGRHGLNFGDCFAYALSKATGEPLLFKGEDFARTDVVSALG